MHEELLCSLCTDIVQNQAIPIHVTTEDEVLDIFEHLQTLLPHSVACRRCIEILLSTIPSGPSALSPSEAEVDGLG